jgi:hypothetical protein
MPLDADRNPAQQVTRSGGFDLPCPADVAFPLFSPDGERGWIQEWDPRPIFPATIEFRPDTVFRQGQGDASAIWTIVDVDWTRHRAEYVRVAPASHAAHLVVKVDPAGCEGCRVNIEYKVTAFAAHGFCLLETFSESAYETRMQNWQRQIEEYLRNKQN